MINSSRCLLTVGLSDTALLAIYSASRYLQEHMSDTHSQVIELLRAEADAIATAATRLQASDIDAAIDLLAKCKGKVILLGVGKSGNIGQKIAATMTSSGTVALFLHPSDALHGGLGIVTADDAVIMLSNSGETNELLELLPYLKQRSVPLLAIVGNVKSTIAQRADVVIDASVDQEACPLNLAPTASTTVALAIGDALAMTLMRAKGMTENDFASNHPGGQFGKAFDVARGGLDAQRIAESHNRAKGGVDGSCFNDYAFRARRSERRERRRKPGGNHHRWRLAAVAAKNRREGSRLRKHHLRRTNDAGSGRSDAGNAGLRRFAADGGSDFANQRFTRG